MVVIDYVENFDWVVGIIVSIDIFSVSDIDVVLI